jgi:HK97 family phage prohead protease
MGTQHTGYRAGAVLARETRQYRVHGLSVRSANKGDDLIISGTPIVYNMPYTVRDAIGEFEETMRPGVARDALAKGADVRFLFNHDGLPLARTGAGTLVLTDGPKALQVRAVLDSRQQLANDLAIAIDRGDVNQMSVGFIVARDTWNEDYTTRDIHSFGELYDVSAVTYPASPSTSIEIAQRMLLGAPVDTSARVRKLWRINKDLHEGRAVPKRAAAAVKSAQVTLRRAERLLSPPDRASMYRTKTSTDDLLGELRTLRKKAAKALGIKLTKKQKKLHAGNKDGKGYQGNADGSTAPTSGSDGSSDGSGTRSKKALAKDLARIEANKPPFDVEDGRAQSSCGCIDCLLKAPKYVFVPRD